MIIRNLIAVSAIIALAGSAAYATPVVLQGQDLRSTSSYHISENPAFSSSFIIGPNDGRLRLQTSADTGGQGATSTVGSVKQVSDVHWTFKLTHSASSGFVVTLSGVRNGERTVTTHVLRSSADPANSTSNIIHGGPVSSFNALQLAATVPQHVNAGSLTFSQLVFDSSSLGISAFSGGSLSAGSGDASQWMLFDEGVDLRSHNWSLSGVLTSSRVTNMPGSDIHFGVSGYALSVIPLPPAAWTGAATLSAVSGVGLLRRRRNNGGH